MLKSVPEFVLRQGWPHRGLAFVTCAAAFAHYGFGSRARLIAGNVWLQISYWPWLSPENLRGVDGRADRENVKMSILDQARGPEATLGCESFLRPEAEAGASNP